MYIPETLNKDVDGGSVTVEIMPLGLNCLKLMYICCQSFIVPLLNFHEMQLVTMYVYIAEF